MFGKQFAGATQLLPNSISGEEADKALEAFNAALRLQFTQNGATPKLPKDMFKFKEYRQSTKHLLMAVGNALQQAMPSGWSFQSCKPWQPLVPRSLSTDRIPLLPEEKAFLGLDHLPDDILLHYIHHYGTNERWLDFVTDDAFYKLSFAADEGTEEALHI